MFTFIVSIPILLHLAMASLSVSVLVGLLVGSTIGVNNGLARTPQMGWVGSKNFQ